MLHTVVMMPNADTASPRPDDARLTDHERIWLEPATGRPTIERLWCQDDVWTGNADYDGELPTKYVRADIADTLHAEIATLQAQLADADADETVAALMALQRHNVPADVQELLLHGDPSRGIYPHALRSVVAAIARHRARKGEG